MSNWKDAYEVQMDLWKWSRTHDGINFMLNLTDWDRLPEETRDLARSLVRAEHEKLLGADPIFVAAEFSDLIDSAYPSFAPEPIRAEDFITPQGFVFYERPLEIATRHPGKTMLFAGFSWTPLVHHADGTPVVAGVALTLYEDLGGPRQVTYDDGGGFVLPRYCPSHLTPWYVGMTFDGNEVDAADIPTAAEAWWKPCQVTLRLMQQKLAARDSTPAHRASRRRGERIGFSPREIVVVRLRRHKAAPTGSEVDVQWSHRWLVHGGWQWRRYGPGRKYLRQVWIGDYVKGPDHLPFLPKGRSFQWEE